MFNKTGGVRGRVGGTYGVIRCIKINKRVKDIGNITLKESHTRKKGRKGLDNKGMKDLMRLRSNIQ